MSSNSLLNSTLSQISLLTPDNWFTWKTEIMMLLGMEGLDGIVEGTEKKDDAKEKDVWEQKDKRSKGVLFFRIDSQYRSLFTSSSTSTSHELCVEVDVSASHVIRSCDCGNFHSSI